MVRIILAVLIKWWQELSNRLFLFSNWTREILLRTEYPTSNRKEIGIFII